MGPKSQIGKWGSSLAVRILKLFVGHWRAHDGSAVERVSPGNKVVMGKKTYRLTDMLAAVTDENLHPEVDTGPAAGNEVW